MNRRPHGFTLVELLVVITIIGMLMSLLLPAVQAAREAGRKATCSNNCRNVAQACLQFETNNRFYPGYINAVGPNTQVSWAGAILPFLERNDLYDIFKTTAIDPAKPPALNMSVFLCPSNPPDVNASTDAPLAYCVNTGRNNSDQGSTKTIPGTFTAPSPRRMCDGVFHDGRPKLNNVANVNCIKVNNDYITSKDGTSNTLMVGETLWGITKQGWAFPPVTSATYKYTDWEQVIGFQWRGVATGTAKASVTANSGNPNLVSEHLKSNHGGGVNVMFCDGRGYFLRDDVDYWIYVRLCCPSDRDATNLSGVLSDRDY